MENETETQLLITGISDEQLASGEKETAAQATIVRVLKGVPSHRRPAVLLCVALVLQADQLVPGFIDRIGTRLRKPKAEGDGE